MKEKDYTKIMAEIAKQLSEHYCPIEEYVDRATAQILIANIYLTNDLLSGFGQDVIASITVISSPRRISVISNGHASFYKNDGNICRYESLEDDINEIRITLGAAIDRMEYEG